MSEALVTLCDQVHRALRPMFWRDREAFVEGMRNRSASEIDRAAYARQAEWDVQAAPSVWGVPGTCRSCQALAEAMALECELVRQRVFEALASAEPQDFAMILTLHCSETEELFDE